MSTTLKILAFMVLCLVVERISAQETFDITVTVKNLDSNKGMVFMALYNSEKDFLDNAYKGVKAVIINEESTATFKDIPSGTYAVSIFHDENDNGKMDSNFMGIPKEDYGASNNAKGFMGPPKWNDAKFELKDKNESITITL